MFHLRREASHGSTTSVASQFRGAGQLLGVAACLGAGATLGAVILGASGNLGGVPVVLFLVMVGAAATIAALAFQRLQSGVARPLRDIEEGVRQPGGGDGALRIRRSGASDLQRIAAELESLSQRLHEERRLRAVDAGLSEHRASTVRQLLRLTQGVGGSLDIDRVLEETGKAAITISGLSAAVIWVRDEVDQRLIAVWDSRRPGQPPGLELVRAGDGGAVARAASSGQIVTSRDADGNADGLAVPLVLGLDTAGVIEALGGGDVEVGSDDFEALEILARHAATAIEAARLHEEVERRSETDGLTRVFNRRRLDTDVRLEVARSVRYGRPLALVMLDLDHFKSINDSYGHQQGDEVLKMVAATLLRECRETDGAYRFGGEEFAVLLRDTDPTAAMAVAERFRHRVQEQVRTLGLPREVTASLGVAAVCPGIETAAMLFEAADLALYEAKRSGRNRVVVGATTHAEPGGDQSATVWSQG